VVRLERRIQRDERRLAQALRPSTRDRIEDRQSKDETALIAAQERCDRLEREAQARASGKASPHASGGAVARLLPGSLIDAVLARLEVAHEAGVVGQPFTDEELLTILGAPAKLEVEITHRRPATGEPAPARELPTFTPPTRPGARDVRDFGEVAGPVLVPKPRLREREPATEPEENAPVKPEPPRLSLWTRIEELL
jgi:hypothetical protein